VRGVQERGAVAPLTRRGNLRAAAFGLAVVVVAADRVTTSLVEHDLHGIVHVWGPFGLALQFNSGLAFSLFTGRSTLVTVVLGVGVLVLGVLVTRVRSWSQAVGGGLVLGGGLGNLSERVVSDHHGLVADFITLSHWPTFNVADACITVGVVVLAASVLFDHPGVVT
jgi:signal peptidase II